MKTSFLVFLAAFFFAASPLCAGSAFENFAATDYSGNRVMLFENGRMVWSHEAPLTNDLWVLPNGNILFTTGHGVLEMTRQNDTVFCYQSSSYIFACQRLKNGNTFVGECSAGRLLEVAPDGRIVSAVSILPEGETDAGMSFIRNARRLDNGHYLVAHYGGKKVAEYDASGKVVWEAPVSGGAHSVMRLKNGRTFVSVADQDKNPRIMEFDKKGVLVREITNKDMQGDPFRFLGGMYAMKDGSIVFANWQGHGTNEGRPTIFRVGRDGKLMESFGPDPQMKTVSSVFVLDRRNRLSVYGH